MLTDIFRDGFDDAGVDVDQIIPAHAGLAGDTGGDDDDIAARSRFISRRAGNLAVIAFDGGRFVKIERLTLRHTIHLRDIDQNDITQLFGGSPVSGGGSDISGPDDADFRATHDETFL